MKQFANPLRSLADRLGSLRGKRVSPGYAAVLIATLLVAVVASWTGLSEGIDGTAYDWVFARHARPDHVDSVVLAFDEKTLSRTGGMRQLRPTLAQALTKLAEAKPRVVAIDLILADTGDSAEDARLAQALALHPRTVLSSDLLPNGVWEDPVPALAKNAQAIGHVHARPDPVSRVLPLEIISNRVRRWAVCLEAFRLYKDATVVESPDALDIGGTIVPGTRPRERAMRILYLPDSVPTVSVADLLDGSNRIPLANKTVFVGVTAQSAARDRLITPLGTMMSGVEIHAHGFETLRHGRFLVNGSALLVLGLVTLICATAGAIFLFFSGWPAYVLAVLLIISSHALPHLSMARGVVIPYSAPVLAAWLSTAVAATWMYFTTRNELRRTETDKMRYRQAIHFVTHEMRSPLTAIQGSSELMGRYNLNDEKRKQMAQMIHSESKRLARMIQTFLDLERLSDGSMEFRRERFDLEELVEGCIVRAQPLADRKQIQVESTLPENLPFEGDRELLEYAVYNLITNAVKYSPQNTHVRITARTEHNELRLSVNDEGIGIDEKDLKNIFKKFYRTRRAETSGEAGTGIGLSIVEQIVEHHNGHMEVTSVLGKGSCFTMVLPRTVSTERTPASRVTTE
jgi:signal transduction histidine kinase